jgi:hypothetical protein
VERLAPGGEETRQLGGGGKARHIKARHISGG